MFHNSNPTISSTQGRLLHEQDVYYLLADVGFYPKTFLTHKHKALFIREHSPDLVPDPVNGDPPGDKSLSDIFDTEYCLDPTFRFVTYKQWFIRENLELVLNHSSVVSD